MGRPRAFDRDAAIGTALEEIWRHGYDASSVNALADKMGISRSSFYNSFGDRDALFAEVLARYAHEAPDRILDDIAADAPIVPAIRQMFRTVCRVRAADNEARGCLAINCMTELAGRDMPSATLLQVTVANKIARLHKLLRQAVRQNELADDGTLRDKARALQVLLTGINTLSKVVRSERQLWRAAATTLDGLGFHAAAAKTGG